MGNITTAVLQITKNDDPIYFAGKRFKDALMRDGSCSLTWDKYDSELY